MNKPHLSFCRNRWWCSQGWGWPAAASARTAVGAFRQFERYKRRYVREMIESYQVFAS